jgi:hypothetical protein
LVATGKNRGEIKIEKRTSRPAKFDHSKLDCIGGRKNESLNKSTEIVVSIQATLVRVNSEHILLSPPALPSPSVRWLRN